MARIRTPKQKSKYKALNKRLLKYVSLVMSLYDDVCKDAATLVGKTDYDGSKPFKFANFPKLKTGLKSLLSDFVSGMKVIIYGGTSDEWKQSNLIQDLLAKDVLRSYGAKISGKKQKVYYQTNSDALKAFQERKDKGMNISAKLWNQSENLRKEMEYAISSAIQKGTSAVTLSKRLSKYLEDFPKLQKDYKQKFGKAVECQNCEYRSIRLARSEINMAYRTAEQERWRQMDFIKGYEIKTSGAHEERMPKGDICDELQGIYPKSFIWNGWHPNCMCYTVPIVMSEDEYWNGNGITISDLPSNFTKWIEDSKDKILDYATRNTLPYWINDNIGAIGNILGLSLNEYKTLFPHLKKYINDLYRTNQTKTFISFEPFSPVINQLLKTKRNLRDKIKIYNDIINDPRAEELFSSDKAKTVLYPNHKGKNKKSWNDTKETAYFLNRKGESVAFLPEGEGEKYADSIILFNGKPTLADFKVSKTKEWNTLQNDLKKGFTQANTIVLRLLNMDSNGFTSTIDYMKRNEIRFGNIKLVSKYGKVVDISSNELITGKYKKKIKGLL